MWDYINCQDSTRISPDKLKEAEIDDSVRAVTKLKKKSFVPKVFGTGAFNKLNPCTEVLLSFAACLNFLSSVLSYQILPTDGTRFVQIIPIARCYPAQPEDGEYPGHEFDETPEESASAAPTTSCTSARRADVEDVDRVEDSEELGARSPSSGDDDGTTIPAKPLDVRPPPQAGKRALPNFGLDTS
jgi:hypothetical protein